MVNAILEGRKTMTRRTMKDNVQWWKMNNIQQLLKLAPYQAGDILWVRETWKPKVFAGNKLNGFDYKADHVAWLEKNGQKFTKNSGCETGEKWKPSIFMPRKAARIFLEVTNVRVERLQDISESDAIAEGVELVAENEIFGGEKYTGEWYKNYGKEGYTFLRPIDSFRTLWESINGEGSWNSNPFVFVYEFKSVEL
jgi:hypothetical protein